MGGDFGCGKNQRWTRTVGHKKEAQRNRPEEKEGKKNPDRTASYCRVARGREKVEGASRVQGIQQRERRKNSNPKKRPSGRGRGKKRSEGMSGKKGP